MRHLVAVLVAVCACGDDPSLQIVVTPPASDPPGRYAALIDKTVVTVYVSELGELTCEQIEFGDVSADLLLGAAVAEQTVSDRGIEGSIDDVPRLGQKLVVARMFSSAGVLVAAGCTEQGDISGDVTVEVETVVAATVSLETLDRVDVDDPYGKQVTILDPLGDSLEGREVRWRVFAPAGADPATQTNVTRNPDEPTIWDSTAPGCTDGRGIVDLHPVPPAKVGGFSARFRVSWSSRPIGVTSSFVRPGVGARPLTTAPPTNRCAVRTVGGRHLVCVENGPPTATRYAVTQNATKHYDVTPAGTVSLASPSVGVVAIDEGGGREVYSIRQNGQWDKLFGTTDPTLTVCPTCTIDDFRVIPACGNQPARLLMHSTTGNELREMGLRGGAVSNFEIPADLATATTAIAINTTGCVTTIDRNGTKVDVPIAVLDFTRLAGGTFTRGVFPCGAARGCSVPLPFPAAGVGFLQVGSGADAERRMLGTAFDISGAELIAWVMRPAGDGTTFSLLERERITAAAPPTNVLVGKLDGDDELDLGWNVRGTRSSLLQVSYAQPIEDGSRLSALAQVGIEIDDLQLGDVTGDGIDDLIGTGAQGVLVLPVHVVGPDAPIRNDAATCAP